MRPDRWGCWGCRPAARCPPTPNDDFGRCARSCSVIRVAAVPAGRRRRPGAERSVGRLQRQRPLGVDLLDRRPGQPDRAEHVDQQHTGVVHLDSRVPEQRPGQQRRPAASTSRSAAARPGRPDAAAPAARRRRSRRSPPPALCWPRGRNVVGISPSSHSLGRRFGRDDNGGNPGSLGPRPGDRLLGRRHLVSGGGRRQFRAQPRRGAGHRRRIRLRQVDHRDVAARPAAEEQPRQGIHRTRRAATGRRRCPRAALDPRPRGFGDLPGADDGAEPGVHHRVPDR